MNVNPKRRWMLAIVAIVVVAGVAGVVLLRNDAEHSLPRLVILTKQHLGREQYTCFQLDALKRRGVSVIVIATGKCGRRVAGDAVSLNAGRQFGRARGAAPFRSEAVGHLYL